MHHEYDIHLMDWLIFVSHIFHMIGHPYRTVPPENTYVKISVRVIKKITTSPRSDAAITKMLFSIPVYVDWITRHWHAFRYIRYRWIQYRIFDISSISLLGLRWYKTYCYAQLLRKGEDCTCGKQKHVVLKEHANNITIVVCMITKWIEILNSFANKSIQIQENTLWMASTHIT